MDNWKDKLINNLLFNDIKDIGEVSDGYHTFNSLYHQRAILFLALTRAYPDKTWKTKRHENEEYCFDKNGEWFLVGIDTPEGPYTYHFETGKYWWLFDCKILEKAPPFDGHTDKDVGRLLSLSGKFCNGVKANLEKREK